MGDDPKPFHNPFAGLGALRGAVPPAPAPREPEPAAPPSGVKPVARAVVRLERSGRGGKDVTVVEQLTLNDRERLVWLKELKASLGCGGTVEGQSLVLQGDQRARLPKLLTARGVKKITVG
jgi:translation initiation factor 1